jgi:hypothetical protein
VDCIAAPRDFAPVHREVFGRFVPLFVACFVFS